MNKAPYLPSKSLYYSYYSDKYVSVTIHIINYCNKTTTETYIVSEVYTKFSLGELGNLSVENYDSTET